MKFGKELTSQMVQEWQEAYMDYNQLKNLLKDIMRFRQNITQRSSGPAEKPGSLKRRTTLYRAFSGLTGLKGSQMKNEDEVILVSAVQQEGFENYQTMFLRSSDDGGEYELIFFRRLDDEFNKVVKFYKAKVQEMEVEADELSKQMDALIALRIKVDKPKYYEEKVAPKAKVAINAANSSPPAINGKNQGERHMDSIQEVEMSTEETSAPMKGFRPAPLEVLDHVKINVDPDTPVSTLRNVIMSSKSDLSFSKDELRNAEEKLTQAFVEFYQQLRLLKSYSFLNMLAFSKIMKKYDKITSRNASKSYLEMVDKSYLGSSDEVNRLIYRLEATFVKHFANGNRRKGMKSLKPNHKTERHRTTFFLGLFTGCSIALVVAIFVAIHGGNLLNHEGRDLYMNNIFPLYSLFLYIILHMLMYGANMYYWRRFRVNYPFIFGFKQGTELGFREILLVASGLSVLALAAVLSNLDMEMDRRTESFQTLTELVPLGLVMVTLSDFFLADQLTSQVQAFRSLQFYACYYALGDFKTRNSNQCLDSNVYDLLYILVAIIPFWSRVLQCLRRLFEEKDLSQGFNGLKYFSTIVALVMRTIYEQRRGMYWKIMAASTSGFTTIYNTYWDIVRDWGLLRKNSKNPWLRDKLLISNKAVYFVAIVSSVKTAAFFGQLVLDFNEAPFLHKKAMVAVVACLEILRRGIWNFFRLENEHFNNVGKYRAFKTVPLPFHYDR
ncbi:hypothetical protein RD792_004215 [Penstemon davidsonii]|uniref:Uncharacterized protein n=1 Tax=Penstemon davidsonii TaxID=160366 RepID=A0ABR0DHS5_9LAMI|nr:hypothetical protein RD792_004215 [Penstemon davidsonii]